MSRRIRLLVLAAGLVLGTGLRGDEKTPYTGSGCAAPVDAFFTDEVWGKVAARICLTCHKKGGDAETPSSSSRIPQRAQGPPGTRPCGTTGRLRPHGPDQE